MYFRRTFYGALPEALSRWRAHFEAVRILREMWPDAKIGSVHNTGIYYSQSFEPGDIRAAARKNALQFLLMDPMILGEYPKELMEYPPFRRYIPDSYPQQLREAFYPMDFWGCNDYTPCFARESNTNILGAKSFDPGLPADAYGFKNYASGLLDELLDFKERYHNIPIFITENGYTDRREDVYNMDLTPVQQDIQRQNYIREHIRACNRAIRAGVKLVGYFYWSAMDCWESTMGYGYPMGLVAVNFDTLERIPRDPFYYYQRIIQSNSID